MEPLPLEVRISRRIKALQYKLGIKVEQRISDETKEVVQGVLHWLEELEATVDEYK